MTDTLADLISRKRLTIKHVLESNLGDMAKQISENLDISAPRQILWHVEHGSDIPLCPVCHTKLKWHPDKRIYRSFCSKKCTGIGTIAKAKATSKERYGCHFSQTPEFSLKIKQTSNDRFGVAHYSKTDEFLDRVKKSNIKKFGVEHSAQNKDIQAKMIQTNQERYGVDNYAQTSECRDKMQSTCQERYGVDNYAQTSECRDKMIQTNQERYGVDHPLQSKKFQKQISDSRKRNYYDPDVLKKLSNPIWLQELFDSGLRVYEIANLLGVSSSNLCKYFNRYNIPINIGRNTSVAENDITEYIKSLGVELIINNDRTILSGKELDIFLPDHKLAIEYNGIYWHTEEKGKDKFYHYSKTKNCQEKGIQLLQITDIDWNDTRTQQIWKGIIRSKLQKNSRIYARKCVVKEIDTTTAMEFFNKNHLKGFHGGSIKLGLFYQDKLVLSIIVGKPRFNKQIKYELIRAASLIGFTITGGLSKLLSRINGDIISYADLSYSSGVAYNQLGFEKIQECNIDYYYVKKDTLEPRYKFQKHKLKHLLENFDPMLSETENMLNHGYSKYWNCGQMTFIKRSKK